MRTMITLINRLGFDSFASNIAVNIIENGDLRDGYRYECDDYSVAVSSLESQSTHQGNYVDLKNKNLHLVTVRAYVDGAGWQTAELVF